MSLKIARLKVAYLVQGIWGREPWMYVVETKQFYSPEHYQRKLQLYLDTERELREELFRLPSGMPKDSKYRRMRYCRYADNFLIGTVGTKKEALEIKEKIEEFIRNELFLEVSQEKTKIVYAREGIRFLGYDLKNFSSPHHSKVTSNGKTFQKRPLRDQLQLSVPPEKVFSFCKSKGYGPYYTKNGGGTATSRAWMINLDDEETILIYNSELRGFAKYYPLAWDVKTKLSRLFYIAEASWLKTYASRHKLSAKKAAKRLKMGDRLGIVAKRKKRDGKGSDLSP